LRRSIIAKTQNGLTIEQIPSELLFASGSGLDPHISPATAIFQIDRIVQARGWSEPSSKIAIEKLIEDLTEGRFLGFIGEPCVNVLQLNLALDNLEE
jgi:K+-transporting ATPase ATPase C chain